MNGERIVVPQSLGASIKSPNIVWGKTFVSGVDLTPIFLQIPVMDRDGTKVLNSGSM
jgi:hypothetical protein